MGSFSTRLHLFADDPKEISFWLSIVPISLAELENKVGSQFSCDVN